MLGLQLSIGSLNDLVDEPLDAGRKPGKPLPRGVVTRRAATIVAAVAGLAGVALSLPSGVATALAAVGVLALGYLYDLRLSRTSLSWLPLAAALPVLPIHAWLGATGTVAPGLFPLVPAAVLAGAGLAIANGLVDVERDAAANRRGIAVALGPRLGWLVHAGLLAVVVLLAVWLAPLAAAADPRGVLAAVRSIGLPLGVAALVVGAAALLLPSATLRERGWELEALGVATAGIAWLAGTATMVTPA